jgi:hypothetical protein
VNNFFSVTLDPILGGRGKQKPDLMGPPRVMHAGSLTPTQHLPTAEVVLVVLLTTFK